MKTCSRCGLEKPLTDFHRDPRRLDGACVFCKPCANESAKQNELKRKTEDPVKFERAKTNRYLRFTYNITIEDYEQMFLEQDGKCAICGEEQQLGIRLCVDHDHACCPGNKSCGKCVRSLLCNRCNTTLGKTNEDVILLERMIDYIKNGG